MAPLSADPKPSAVGVIGDGMRRGQMLGMYEGQGKRWGCRSGTERGGVRLYFRVQTSP